MAYKYFCFEGLDGCGKDTQLMMAIDWLRRLQSHVQILITSEHSEYTDAGKEIAEHQKNHTFGTAEETLALFVKDRKEQAVLRKQVLKIGHIFGSRSDLSSYGYQAAQGMTFDEIWKAHDYDSGNIVIPDLTFYFELPVDIIMERIHERREKLEAFEKDEFLAKVYKNYHDAVEYLRKQRNIVVINANQTREVIFEEVKKQIREELTR